MNLGSASHVSASVFLFGSCRDRAQHASMLLNSFLQMPRSMQVDVFLSELNLIRNDASHIARLLNILLQCAFQVLLPIKRRTLRCVCRMGLNGRFFYRTALEASSVACQWTKHFQNKSQEESARDDDTKSVCENGSRRWATQDAGKAI